MSARVLEEEIPEVATIVEKNAVGKGISVMHAAGEHFSELESHIQ